MIRDIDDSKAPLLDHLIELRRRLLWCVLALFAAFFACLYFAKPIFAVLVQPRASRSRVRATPSFVIGTQLLEGMQPASELRKALDAALANAK